MTKAFGAVRREVQSAKGNKHAPAPPSAIPCTWTFHAHSKLLRASFSDHLGAVHRAIYFNFKEDVQIPGRLCCSEAFIKKSFR